MAQSIVCFNFWIHFNAFIWTCFIWIILNSFKKSNVRTSTPSSSPVTTSSNCGAVVVSSLPCKAISNVFAFLFLMISIFSSSLSISSSYKKICLYLCISFLTLIVFISSLHLEQLNEEVNSPVVCGLILITLLIECEP